MQTEIRLGGSGGQGLILAGIILGETAIKEGKLAVQTQSYGPEARGGASKAEVIISKDEILYPKVDSPQILLALTQEAYNKYGKNNIKNSTIIVDESVKVEMTKEHNIISLPIIRSAKEVLGKPIVANIISLGVLQAVTKIVEESNLEDAVAARVPKALLDLNKQALKLGKELYETFQNNN